MIYSQRDSQWANQRLGTVNGWTIGQYGCFVTAYAQVATHFGHQVTPANLDDIFTERGLYVDGGLCTDSMLTQVFPDIVYAGTYHFENSTADLGVLVNTFEDEYIFELDFDHDPNDGIQTHFVRFVSFDGNSLIIDDPWFGTEDNFALHYGTDPGTTIQKIIHYRGPVNSPAPETPAPVAPDVQPPSTPESPTTNPEPTSTPSNPEISTTSSSPSNTPVIPQDGGDDKPEQDVQADPIQITIKPVPPVDEHNSDSILTPVTNQPTIKTKENPMSKFLSRKLLIVLLTIALMIANQQYDQAIAAVIAYLGVQGYVDAKTQ